MQVYGIKVEHYELDSEKELRKTGSAPVYETFTDRNAFRKRLEYFKGIKGLIITKMSGQVTNIEQLIIT